MNAVSFERLTRASFADQHRQAAALKRKWTQRLACAAAVGVVFAAILLGA